MGYARRTSLAMALSATACLSAAAGSAQEPELETAVPLEAAAAELPEGVSVGRSGDFYVTLGPPFFVEAGPGWVKRIAADGNATTLAAFTDGAPAGIVVGADGDVFFARPNPGNEASRGVYRVTEGDDPERMTGTESLLVANGLALDGQDSLYASDSALGTIWRIPLDGSAAEPWYSDPSIGGCGGEGEVGANGVALWEGSLYVASTSRGLLVRIPIEPDGTAGSAEVVAGDDSNECEPDALFGMDGIAFGSDGAVYATLVLQNQLVRIDPTDGSHEALLTGDDGLHNPASLAFGTLEGDRTSLYITNYAVLPPVPENALGPAVLRFDVGVEGAPLP